VGDENITLVEVRDNTRETVDAWIDLSMRLRGDCDPDGCLLVVADMSGIDYAFSPYLMKRGAQMMEFRREIPTYIGWVINDNFVGRMIEALLQRGTVGNAEFFITHSRANAFDWVRAKYDMFQQEQQQTRKRRRII